VTLVSGDMARVVALGVLLGPGAAWALARMIASLLYGVDAHDQATFVAVPLLLGASAAAAAMIPALRAVRVSPTEVLRAD
jgi:putative ABC transport system permease protein